MPSNVVNTKTLLPLTSLEVYALAGELVSTKSPSEVFAKETTVDEQLPWDWNHVAHSVWKTDNRKIVLFDGDCNLCNGGVNLLLDMDTSNEFRFCSLSSKFVQSLLAAHGKDPNDRSSIVVIAPLQQPAKGKLPSKYLHKSEAVMAIASKLEGAPSWVKAMTAVGTLAPAKVSDWLLEIVADNRHRVGGKVDESCRLDLDGEFEGRFLNDWEHEDFFVPRKNEEELQKEYSDIIFS